MYRFNLPYYMYDRGYYHVPYNYYRGYVYSPYNYFQSNIANTNQSIYNSGYMTDVFQNSNIIQSGIGCTQVSSGIGTTENDFNPVRPPIPIALECELSLECHEIAEVDSINI